MGDFKPIMTKNHPSLLKENRLQKNKMGEKKMRVARVLDNFQLFINLSNLKMSRRLIGLVKGDNSACLYNIFEKWVI